MRTALIGYSGFVGSNLLAARHWDACYNSRNFREMAGQSFDLVVCAGVSAVKWQANKEPDVDWARIAELIDMLGTVRAGTFVLVSTIDVFPNPVAVDEAAVPSLDDGHPYGRHRLRLESWARAHFAQSLVVRLPGCFGPGLKKNALFDLLHGNLVEAIDPDAQFQFYDVRRLSSDIEVALRGGLSLVHMATAPVAMRDLARQVFSCSLTEKPGPHVRYDFRTRHAALWGRTGAYLTDADEVTAAIAEWVISERLHATAGS